METAQLTDQADLETLISVFSPPSKGIDEKANSEAVSLASGTDLEKDGKKQEHSRHQTFRNHLNKATIWLFWAVVLGLVLGVLAFIFHLITPTSWHYLSDAQFEKLQTILVAALVSSSLRGYVDQRMK